MVERIRKGLKNHKAPGAVAFDTDHSSRGQTAATGDRLVPPVPCEPSGSPRQVFGSPIFVRYPFVFGAWGLRLDEKLKSYKGVSSLPAIRAQGDREF